MKKPDQTSPVVQRDTQLFLRIGPEWFYYDTMEQPLGEGAMGTVYRGRGYATHEQVAIKRVKDYYANFPAIRERAKLEASLLFRHRNLVEMIGYCEVHPHHGPIFIVSKLVQGITLDRHVNAFLRSRPDPVKRICECIYPVLDALHYLHQQNIVHMDIKPSNIMVENGCNIRLMDLGIATTDADLGISQSGMVGTPKYAAPEQIYDENQPKPVIDATTDIYEIGVTLYELLSGYNPFDAATRDETICKQKTMILPASKSIPKSVLTVLRKATEKQQSARYKSALEFKQALQTAVLHRDERSVWWMPVLVVLAVAIIGLIVHYLCL